MKVVATLAFLTMIPVLVVCGQSAQRKSSPPENSNQSRMRDEITQKEQLWASAINENSPATVSSLLDESFHYSSRAQSDFDSMIIGDGENLSRSQYINEVTDADVLVRVISREIKVTAHDSDRATARFKIEVRAGVSGQYGIVPRITPGTYEVTDEWINKSGWKAVSRDARRLLKGRLVPVN